MADVQGTITFDDQVINVTGLGYHEHAHGVSFPVKEWGWYWGKIVGENTSLFWGKMMNTRWDEQARAGVFSIKDAGYQNIMPDYIQMELFNYSFDKRRFIPDTFIFDIYDPEKNIQINVTMTTLKIYHLPLGFFNYWRYIIQINGYIIYDDIKEELIDKIQIMELMRFR